MQKCCELGRLPKASRQLKSLNFKRTTPGSIIHKPGTHILDPRHPIAQSRQPKIRTSFSTPDIQIRIMHKALLYAPTDLRVDPPLPVRRKTGQVNVSIQNLMYNSVLPKAVLRSKVATKIRTALSLIVTRGADVEKDAEGREKIMFREADAGRRWIMDDWTYIVRPTLEVYRMPYQTLIPILREGLITLRRQAEKAEKALTTQRPADHRSDTRKKYPQRGLGRSLHTWAGATIIPKEISHTTLVDSATPSNPDEDVIIPSETKYTKSPVHGDPTAKVDWRDLFARLPLHNVSKRPPRPQDHFPSQSNYGPQGFNPLARRFQGQQEIDIDTSHPTPETDGRDDRAPCTTRYLSCA